jgi:dTDP-4-amino-4,6-dideoxygalactose transaminase
MDIMRVLFVDLRKQYDSIKNEINEAIDRVIQDSAFIGGAHVQHFEAAFANFCQAQYCIGVGNGTDALYITLRALGIGRGDEVITVANSFIATSEAITMTGARVVFVDCDSKSYNIDTKKIPAVITPKTKAIIPVHLYGQPANMPALKKITEVYGLFLVEDAAQAHGAEIDGKRVGGFGNAACFSFYPGKNLGAYGDAGAIVTNDEKLALKCRMIANHGRVKKYDHDFEGLNSRLDGIQAAILSVKLKHLDSWTEKRREIASTYRELLKGAKVILPEKIDGFRHVYHLFVVRVSQRQMVQKKLMEYGIETGIHYPIALPNLAAYKYLGHKPEDFPLATQYSHEILSLPMYPELSLAEIQYICEILKKIIKT